MAKKKASRWKKNCKRMLGGSEKLAMKINRIVIPEIFYKCFFCDEERSFIEGSQPIYKIIIEQCGETKLCICPDCIKNLKSMLMHLKEKNDGRT